jgi:glycosyltransferase involved in cell wall biosynthesis
MKNVLLSAYACLPNHGSEEGNGWHYATLLSEKGLTIHCLTRPQGRAAIEAACAAGTWPNLRVHYVTLPGPVERLYHRGLLGMYLHYLCWQWAAYRLARRLDRVQPFDLVHHVTYGSIQLGSFLYRLRRPFLFGPVGGGQRAPKAFKRYFGTYWTREWMRDLVGLGLQYLNPAFFRSVRGADRLLVTNRDTLALARKLRPARPIDLTFDSAVSSSLLPPAPIERPARPALRLLWVGRLLPRKALELTIEAFGRVDPALPITLTIVGGKGEMAEHVPEYLRRYDRAGRIEWVGHVSYDEVKRHYTEADVFFFTSLRDSCPMQLLEAMAYALPVVTLDLHGQAELVSEQTGLTIPVQTPEQVVTDLARAIEWLYAQPEKRQAMGRAAYAFARTQTWERKIDRFVSEWYPATQRPAATRGRSVPEGAVPVA